MIERVLRKPEGEYFRAEHVIEKGGGGGGGDIDGDGKGDPQKCKGEVD
jgi:hypothetical protein